VRYDDEFGGYPYILGVKGNDGAILNIFWDDGLSNPRWVPSIGSHRIRYWTVHLKKWTAQTYHHDWMW